MRLIVTSLAVALAPPAHANEPSAEEIVAQRLAAALETSTALANSFELQGLRPDDRRACYSAQTAIMNPSEFYALPVLGDENRRALGLLAENLELICERGPRTSIEVYGLKYLTSAALESVTNSGIPLREYLGGFDPSMDSDAQGTKGASESDPGLAESVARCWNIGALSSDALNTTVFVKAKVDATGRVRGGSIALVDRTGETQANASDAERQAYEAGRRALLRCGASGLGVPPGQYLFEFSARTLDVKAQALR